MDIVPYKKEFNKRVKNAREKEKRSTCFICGKEIEGTKNSHTVPHFILKNISENGHLAMCGSFAGKIVDDLIGNNKGLNDASTFHMICEDCENKFFKDYESLDKIEMIIKNINNFDDDFTRKQLAEIYIKSLIKEIYTKTIFDKHVNADFIHELINNKSLDGTNTDKITDLTLRDYLIDYKYCLDLLAGDKGKGFIKYYHYVLPYRLKIATQTLICLRRGLHNETINFCQSTDENLKMEEICFVCFPLEKTTLLLIYGLKTSKEVYKDIFRDINKMSHQDKLKVLQAILFSHSEEVYVAPSLKEIMSHDEQFQKIANQELLPTPFPTYDGGCLLVQSYVRIDEFRKCRNCYFDRKFSKH